MIDSFKQFLNKKVESAKEIAKKDKLPVSDVQKELKKGISTEKEHTTKKDVAKQILNSEDTFTVRPEKITLELGKVKESATQRSATGKVQEVEYLGPSTRFIVKLDAGTTLVVLKQNSTETSEEVNKLRNQIVTLLWEKQSEYRVGS